MSERHNNLRKRWGLLSLVILALIFPFAVIGMFLLSPLFIILLFCCFCWCLLAVCLVEVEDRQIRCEHVPRQHGPPSGDCGPPVDPLPPDQRPKGH
ncbi:hypothetical protein ACHWQZ_G019367 [Mnemiopsis leidyi]